MIRVFFALIRGCLLFFPGRSILVLRRFLSWKLVLKLRHPNFLAAEFHAFHLQSKALIQAAFAGDRNASPRGHHAMPGKSFRLAQCTDHKTRAAGNPGGAGNSSIAGDMAARDTHDGRADTLKSRVWLLGVWLFRFCHQHILWRFKKYCADFRKQTQAPSGLLARWSAHSRQNRARMGALTARTRLTAVGMTIQK